MTVQASQGHDPGDTPSKELDRLIGAAADAARVLVGSVPSDRANWLDLVRPGWTPRPMTRCRSRLGRPISA